jgi:alpha-mannosidase
LNVDVWLVSHFHWDREWYRTFDEFRGRLVDAIDAVLELLDADPGFRFLLDGQTIVLDDYLEVRPQNRDAIAAGVRAGRLAIGPWYVQPDSLLPSGETHVRNLLYGRALADQLGGASRVAYVPDSFGHPAQFPQLFSGFGLDPFVYWRGNGSELDALGSMYRWRAPDGSEVRAWYLAEGYFGAGGLDADGDVDATVARLKPVIDRLATSEPILLMNGFDHLPADTSTGPVAEAIGARRALLDDVKAALPDPSTLDVFSGSLTGGRTTNLLPGVWSSRMPIKLANRATESLLQSWVEPWIAFGRAFGLADERPALDRCWKLLLANQAHDSIGGCSIDAVHERMRARYDDAQGLGRATLTRVLERLAGRDLVRNTPKRDAQDVVVFNASATPRTDVVRIPLEGFPPWKLSVGRFDFHPLAMPSFAGLTIDGEPVRMVRSDDPARVRFLHEVGGFDIEFVARDVPAFGCAHYRLEPAEASPETIDEERAIDAGAVRVRAADNGTLDVTIADRTFTGLFGLEDCVDRGDSYDADCDLPRPLEVTTSVQRMRHASGIERLVVTRRIDDIGTLTVTATVAPGVPFVRCDVHLDNEASDHRLRLRFPTGAPVEAFEAASTFDEESRSTEPSDDTGWVHPAPRTFVQQGFVAANGLVVGAPGLPEAEVTGDGDILVTLVRSVGQVARIKLRTRPVPAAPDMPAPGAQTIGPVDATITIATSAADARAAEVGVRAVLGDDHPLLAAGASLLALNAHASFVSACKPGAEPNSIVVRVLNPSDAAENVSLTFGVDINNVTSVRLDETPDEGAVTVDGRRVDLRVEPHALRTVVVQTLRR